MLQQLDARTNDTIANITAKTKQEEEMKGSLLALNTTLISKVEALRTTIEEITLKNVSNWPTAFLNDNCILRILLPDFNSILKDL